MPSRTMKATKTLDLGAAAQIPGGKSKGLQHPIKKLVVRSPVGLDRKAAKEGSIVSAVLITEARDATVAYLSEPAALGLLKGLLAVIHPQVMACDDELCGQLLSAVEEIREATDNARAVVDAVVNAPSLETVPATMDPPEGEQGPDPTATGEASGQGAPGANGSSIAPPAAEPDDDEHDPGYREPSAVPHEALTADPCGDHTPDPTD